MRVLCLDNTCSALMDAYKAILLHTGEVHALALSSSYSDSLKVQPMQWGQNGKVKICVHVTIYKDWGVYIDSNASSGLCINLYYYYLRRSFICKLCHQIVRCTVSVTNTLYLYIYWKTKHTAKTAWLKWRPVKVTAVSELIEQTN